MNAATSAKLAMLGVEVNHGRLSKAEPFGPDKNAFFPGSDSEDMARGARFIPNEVTLARRQGMRVVFVQECGPCCWYWQLPEGLTNGPFEMTVDGTLVPTQVSYGTGKRIYHFDRFTYEAIARANGRDPNGELAGPCPRCGNEHTNGAGAEA